MIAVRALLMLAYFAAVFVVGSRILRACIRDRDGAGLHIPASFLLGLFFSFVIFVAASPVFPSAAIYASIIVPGVAALVSVVAKRTFPFGMLQTASKQWIIAAGALTLLLLLQYALECGSMLRSSATGDGVIYQDVIYHSTIVQSLARFGFPAKNLLFDSQEIGYHIFSHFVCAQISTVLNIRPDIAYVFVVTPLFFALIAASAISFIKTSFDALSPLATVAVAYMGIFASFVFWTTTQPALPLYLSHSYQLQLACVLLILAYIHVLYTSRKAGYAVLIGLLFAESIVVKGSSIPILGSFMAMMVLFESVHRGRVSRSGIISLLGMAGVSVVMYWLFFGLQGFDALNNRFGFYFDRLYEMKIPSMLSGVGGEWSPLVLAAALASAVSFRIVLVRRGDVIGMALFASFMICVLMYWTIRFGAVYFLLAMLCPASMYALAVLAYRWPQMGRVMRLAAVGAVLVSLYPFTSGGVPAAYVKMQRKADNYFSLTQDKLELYSRLEDASHRQSLIFTPSIEAAPGGVPDNYYPAAMTGRQFYLGGYRLRMQDLPGLEERVAFVKTYSPASESDYRRLKSLGVDFVLIETADVEAGRRREFEDAIDAPEWYEVAYRNDAGAILRPL